MKTDREIAFEVFREIAQDATLEEQDRLQAASYLMHDPDSDFVVEQFIQDTERRLTAIEGALPRKIAPLNASELS